MQLVQSLFFAKISSHSVHSVSVQVLQFYIEQAY